MLLNAQSTTPLADGIKREVHEGRRNYSILVTGRTQTRKSTISITLAREVDPDWDIETQLAIAKTRQMLEVLNLDALKRGSAIILDEVGVGMNHRQWYTFLNQAMSYTMQTHGFLGHVVIVTVPYSDYVDNDVRKLFDMVIEVLDKHDRGKYATARVVTVNYNQKLQREYQKFPRCRFPDGTVRIVRKIRIKYPPDEVMDRYFQRANEAKQMLSNELTASANRLEADKLRKGAFDLDHYVGKVLEDPAQFIQVRWGRRFISRELIMNKFIGIGDTRARQIKAKAENKLGFGEGVNSGGLEATPVQRAADPVPR